MGDGEGGCKSNYKDCFSSQKTDLTGSCHYGFKKNFVTETACFEIQTNLSNACDNGDYAALALLDLSAIFDVVDRKLLKKCTSHLFN
jgi:hypothetical protein